MGRWRRRGGEEDNDEEDGVVMWLSVKVMSKMSDGELCSHFNTNLQKKGSSINGELCSHFNTDLQKKGSSICRNRQCNCLAILRNGNAHSSTARYMTWFAWQTQYEQNSIFLQWIRFSTLLRMEGQRRTNYFRLQRHRRCLSSYFLFQLE